MSSSTLTSLAMLKVKIDQGGDYVDYLRPFVLQVLVDHRPDPVTDGVVRAHIGSEFGLEIPDRVVQIVLKRLSRKHPLKKAKGVYHITGDLPDPGITAEKSKAARHIHAVVSGLTEFSKSTARPIGSTEDAVTALCTFLAEFDIPCLRAYLRGTAIPTIKGKRDSDIVLVSKYVLHLQQTDPERFESLMIMVQGHMLANALLCPDLQSAPKTYEDVTFYLDTPLLIRRLGLEGEAKQAAIENLIDLLCKLGANLAIFSHSRDELDRVIRGASTNLDNAAARTAIVREARSRGTTKSDLLLVAGQIDNKINQFGVKVAQTPAYEAAFQIDENVFETVLKDEVSYLNPRAKADDINSVRSIYVLRKGISPSIVERAKAVFVTSNSGFARAAWQYGQQHEESREVSSVITDFSLANMAWLKVPMGAPSLPMVEVLAFSYAALQPSEKLLNKYMTEIEKLERQGKITARDHQLLRSSTLAEDELMGLTLGDEEALTEQTITETLRRVTAEITKEKTEKLTAEQEAHRETRGELALQRAEKKKVLERVYWRCSRRAKRFGGLVSSLIGIFLIAGFIAGLGLRASNPIVGWILAVGSGVFGLLGLSNLVLGTTVKGLQQRVEDRCMIWLLKRQAIALGLDLSEVQ